MTDSRDLLNRTAELSADFLESLDTRPVLPEIDLDTLRAELTRPLQDEPIDAREVLEQLVADADPGIAGMPGGRWFGFVLGGSLPASASLAECASSTFSSSVPGRWAAASGRS